MSDSIKRTPKAIIRQQVEITSSVSGRILGLLQVSKYKWAIIERQSSKRDNLTAVYYSYWKTLEEFGNMKWLDAFNTLIELGRK